MTDMTDVETPRWLVLWSGGLEDPVVKVYANEDDAMRTFDEYAKSCGGPGDSVRLYNLSEWASQNGPVLVNDYPRT